jgi:hypothetical protein
MIFLLYIRTHEFELTTHLFELSSRLSGVMQLYGELEHQVCRPNRLPAVSAPHPSVNHIERFFAVIGGTTGKPAQELCRATATRSRKDGSCIRL